MLFSTTFTSEKILIHVFMFPLSQRELFKFIIVRLKVLTRFPSLQLCHDSVTRLGQRSLCDIWFLRGRSSRLSTFPSRHHLAVCDSVTTRLCSLSSLSIVTLSKLTVESSKVTFFGFVNGTDFYSLKDDFRQRHSSSCVIHPSRGHSWNPCYSLCVYSIVAKGVFLPWIPCW